MSSSSLAFLLSLFTLLLSTNTRSAFSADADDNTGYNTFIYSGCSPPHYSSGSSYESYVDSILASISDAAAASSFANFTSPGAVSGLYQCRADLPGTACASCVRSARSQLPSLCPSAAGAAVQLRDCLLRYGNDSFLGKPDRSLLFKKCGAVNSAGIGGGGGDVDAALEAVTEGRGEYRVGGAGRVQAVAQCVGDLIEEECGECVKAAVEQLESECGAAAEEGEVYLGKCYVRYWSDEEQGGGGGGGIGGGGGGIGGGGGGGGGGIGGGGIGGIGGSGGIGGGGRLREDDDQSEKIVAIIVGIMIGVALLIAFFSFLRRSGRGK